MRLGFRSEHKNCSISVFDFRIKVKIPNNNIEFIFCHLTYVYCHSYDDFSSSRCLQRRVYGGRKSGEMQGYLLRLNVYPENGFRIPFSCAYSWQSYSKMRADRRTNKHIVALQEKSVLFIYPKKSDFIIRLQTFLHAGCIVLHPECSMPNCICYLQK